MKLRYLFPFKDTIHYNPLKKKKIGNPKTLGEKIYNRRLELGLLQKEVANILDVTEDTITNWENNRAQPQVQFYPRLIKFLGYVPFIIDTTTLAGKIKEYRYVNGLSQKHLALKLRVNESTVFNYENNKHIPRQTLSKKLEGFFRFSY